MESLADNISLSKLFLVLLDDRCEPLAEIRKTVGWSLVEVTQDLLVGLGSELVRLRRKIYIKAVRIVALRQVREQLQNVSDLLPVYRHSLGIVDEKYL